jgi:Tol biopolymer transport system component
MTDVRTILERVGDRVPMPEPAFERILLRRARRRRTQRLSAGLVALVLTAALILSLTQIHPGRSRRPATAPTVPTNGWIVYSGGVYGTGGDIYITREGVDPRRIVGSDGDRTAQYCPEFSPDGSMLAYAVATPAFKPGADLAIVVTAIAPSGAPVGEAQRIEIPPLEEPNLLCAEWSPDSRRLAYSASGVWVASLGGGPPRRISDEQTRDFAWSPDGSAIALSRGDGGVQVVSADDGELVSFAGGIPGGTLTWSPDGDRIAMGRDDSEGKNPGIVVIDARDGAVHILETGDPPIGGDPAWSPDGTKIAFDHDGRVVLANPDTGGVVILPRVRVEDGSKPIRGGIGSVEWSPDGRWLIGLAGTGTGAFAVIAAPADGTASWILLSPLPDAHSFTTAAYPDWQEVHA